MIAQQLPLPAILAGLVTTNKTVGIYGEMWLADRLQRQGYKVAINHKWRRGDLQIFQRGQKPLFIEVKTARQGKDGRWSFKLVKLDKYGSTDHRRTDFVVLLCITKAGQVVPFVIPTGHCLGQKTINIPSNPRTYAGKFACFRQSISKLVLNQEQIQ